MAVLRDHPYAGFNFLVDLGNGQSEGPHAGFQEVGGIGVEVALIEYRNGNDKNNAVTKLPGLHKIADITLKRGTAGALELWQWLEQVRRGDPAAVRNVTVRLQNEDHTAVVLAWKLRRARIVKYRAGPLNARASEVAIEEIVIAAEGLELE